MSVCVCVCVCVWGGGGGDRKESRGHVGIYYSTQHVKRDRLRGKRGWGKVGRGRG